MLYICIAELVLLCAYAGSGSVKLSMWGDGEQTRSFCYIDDCVEGLMRLMISSVATPLNLGSDEMVSMNELLRLALSYRSDGGEAVQIGHIPGPEGVRGRNSDNTRIQMELGWAPNTLLKDGLKQTFDWIATQIMAEAEQGIDTARYRESQVVRQSTASLDALGQHVSDAVAIDATESGAT